MFQLLFLVTFFIGNFIGFRITLRLLKVQESVNKRSLILTLSFLATQVLAAIVTRLTGLTEPATVVISMVLFAFVIRKFLVLRLWQVIVIPIGVSFMSSVVLAIGLMLTISLWGPIRVG